MNTKTQTTKCQKVYTTRDGGSTLICTEAKGHKDAHYSDGTGPAWQGRQAR